MGKADNEHNTRRLRQRILQLKNALDAGADPLWVDYAFNVAVRRHLGVGLPSDKFLGALVDALDGASSAYLRRRKANRPTLERRLHLMGGVAFAMEMLITTQPIVFKPSDAALLISNKLNAAGIPPFGGRARREEWEFTENMVVQWHDRVVNQATARAPERQIFEALAKNPARRPPEQEKWGQQRRENERKAWLDRFIAGISREYFSAKL
jgi:hypothetical protein